MTKKIYLSIIAVAAATFCTQAAEPITVEFKPAVMQYMCKPGALPDTDVLVFNLTETDFYPDHSPKGYGWTLALEAVGPLSNTSVNEDPGVPVGEYTVGYGWDETGKYIPYVIRNYSELRQRVADSDSYYTNHFEVVSGNMDLTLEDGKYYVSGSFKAVGTSLYDSQEVTLNMPRTEITPQYTFFGYPEVEDGYIMENPGLVASYYTKSFRNTQYWAEYNLEFYTTPLDDTMTVDGEGAVMSIVLCNDIFDVVKPEYLAGEYQHKTYLSNYFSAFDIRGGFIMEVDLVFGRNEGSRITVYDKDGYPIKSSYCTGGTALVTYLGDNNFLIEVEMINQFGQKYYCSWEGLLFDILLNAPAFDGINDVTIDTPDTTTEYFDLTGKQINGMPTRGIYITRQGNTVKKVTVN